MPKINPIATVTRGMKNRIPRVQTVSTQPTTAAMVLARPLARKPRDIATDIVARIDRSRAGISAAEIAGPGFINFRVAADALAGGLRDVLAAGDAYGRSDYGADDAVNVTMRTSAARIGRATRTACRA